MKIRTAELRLLIALSVLILGHGCTGCQEPPVQKETKAETEKRPSAPPPKKQAETPKEPKKKEEARSEQKPESKASEVEESSEKAPGQESESETRSKENSSEPETTKEEGSSRKEGGSPGEGTPQETGNPNGGASGSTAGNRGGKNGKNSSSNNGSGGAPGGNPKGEVRARNAADALKQAQGLLKKARDLETEKDISGAFVAASDALSLVRRFPRNAECKGMAPEIENVLKKLSPQLHRRGVQKAASDDSKTLVEQ